MFNIFVIRPDGYNHDQAFDELVDLIRFALIELGLVCTVSRTVMAEAAANILVGCHLLNPDQRLPDDVIILNTEPLFSRQNPNWTERIIAYARTHRLWDYNERNILALQEHGIEGPQLLRIGYQRELVRIASAQEQDIDVLFYGSINPRRLAVLDELQKQGLNVVKLFGVYGVKRDQFIARSKLVLNMHYYNQHIFEVVRVFYLMTNGKAVVTEVGDQTSVEPRFLNGLRPAPYERLVEECLHLARNTQERLALETCALQSIRQWPQSALMADLLSTMKPSA